MQTPVTAHRGYQKPHASNKLSDDVLRIIAALDALDVDINTILTQARTVEGIQTFTVSPVIPTATPGDNTTKAANTAFVQAAIAALVASSPAALDTLNELSAALGNDANFATTITTALSGKAATSHAHTAAQITDFNAAAAAQNVKLAGDMVQIVNFQTGAWASGTATIPCDDSIPQITEGTEFMTLAVTPTSATNKLKIEVVAMLSNSAASQEFVAALFQDSNANAIAMQTQFMATLGGFVHIHFTHFMAAGTTSPITFRVRGGGNNAGTTSFNGLGARFYGGAIASSITITEIKQ